MDVETMRRVLDAAGVEYTRNAVNVALYQMAKWGLLSRVRRGVYTLTERGRELAGVIREMVRALSGLPRALEAGEARRLIKSIVEERFPDVAREATELDYDVLTALYLLHAREGRRYVKAADPAGAVRALGERYGLRGLAGASERDVAESLSFLRERGLVYAVVRGGRAAVRLDRAVAELVDARMARGESGPPRAPLALRPVAAVMAVAAVLGAPW